MTLHRTTSAALLKALEFRGISGGERQVLIAILAGRGRPVSLNALIQAVYGTGGPADPEGVIEQYLFRLRRKGYNVKNRAKWGWYLSPGDTAPDPLRDAA